jgi:hypothetical protein
MLYEAGLDWKGVRMRSNGQEAVILANVLNQYATDRA